MGPLALWFANTPGYRGSIRGRVIPKWYLMSLCLTLSIIRYRSKVKWSNPVKGCLRITLDYSRPTYIYIYIYI